MSFLECGLLGMDDISQSVLSLRSAPDVQLTGEMPENEGQTACSGLSPGGQWASPSATEGNSSWEYRFRNHVSLSDDGTEESLFASSHQSVKLILKVTVIQMFVSLPQ